MTVQIYFSLLPTNKGERIDLILALIFPEYSRATLQTWLKNGEITVDGKIWRPKDKLKGGEFISFTESVKTVLTDSPEDIPLDIMFEDEHLLIVNKPSNFVVHPGAGNREKTLLNALLYHHPALKNLPRAGIIHRLDKDTSGLLIVAKTLPAFQTLTENLKDHQIIRQYHTLVVGIVISGGEIDAPIGRHRNHRTKMAVNPHGKPAHTHYRVLEKFPRHTYLQVQLETGRTHQIRVHMAHINHAVVGDPLYNRQRLSKGASPELQTLLQNFPRQALHAKTLRLLHPHTGEPLEVQSPLPPDFETLLKALRNSR
jgi:23S rRNA pseudouridine1911/1915/1917 synthase